MSKFCSKCGCSLNDDAVFCTNCGSETQTQTSTNVVYQQVVYVKPKVPGRGLGIASMVLGIIGAFYAFVIFISTLTMLELLSPSYFSSIFSAAFTYSVLPILSLCFAISSKRKGYRNGVSTAGLILGIIGLLFLVLSAIIITVIILNY